jgi:hypothetical protein
MNAWICADAQSPSVATTRSPLSMFASAGSSAMAAGLIGTETK